MRPARPPPTITTRGGFAAVAGASRPNAAAPSAAAPTAPARSRNSRLVARRSAATWSTSTFRSRASTTAEAAPCNSLNSGVRATWLLPWLARPRKPTILAWAAHSGLHSGDSARHRGGARARGQEALRCAWGLDDAARRGPGRGFPRLGPRWARLRPEEPARQLGCRGRRERGQDRPCRDRPAGRRRLRERVPRPHAADHGDDG